VLTQREVAKERRQAAYQSAKARRATDPRYLAAKEAAKVQRRAAYQKAKERRKSAVADEKAKRKAAHTVECETRRAESDRELMKLVTQMLEHSKPHND
jgi:hypothetical protein